MPFSRDQIEHDAGIDLAGRVPIGRPSSAVKPIVLSTLRPSCERAHRGAAAEMGDDHPAASRCRARPRGRRLGDVFVGQAVKAVAADALGIEAAAGWRSGRRRASWPRWNAVSKQATCGSSGRFARAASGSARDCSAGAAAPADVSARGASSTSSSISTGRSYPGRHARRGGRRRRSRRRAASAQPVARQRAIAAGKIWTALGRIGLVDQRLAVGAGRRAAAAAFRCRRSGP